MDRKDLIQSMYENMSYSEEKHPQVGIFWYDTKNQELFGVKSIDPDELQWAVTNDIKSKTIKNLHKDIWLKEFRRGKDKRFVGDYTKVPRGRVFEYYPNNFVVYVGDWINDYPEAKKDILYEFELPEKTEFIKDIHWDIGHGWSDEII